MEEIHKKTLFTYLLYLLEKQGYISHEKGVKLTEKNDIILIHV